MTDNVIVTNDGAVQIVRMNRPEKKNALTRAMYEAMAKALRDGDADPAIRCHLFLGQPGAFSAGNDMADFIALASGNLSGDDVFDFLYALANSQKPIVSAADGIAVGIGATIHFHCDLTFATPRTEFRTPFIDLGITPEAGSTLLAPVLMGRQQAFAMLALGEGFSAERALAAGLIYRIVGEDELEAAALAAAENIAAKPPEALKIARDLILGPRDALLARIREEGDHFMGRLKSDEARNAFMAFMSRKKG